MLWALYKRIHYVLMDLMTEELQAESAQTVPLFVCVLSAASFLCVDS